MFEKVGLAKRVNENNKQPYPQWIQMEVGRPSLIDMGLEECEKAFQTRGPVGLLKIFLKMMIWISSVRIILVVVDKVINAWVRSCKRCYGRVVSEVREGMNG